MYSGVCVFEFLSERGIWKHVQLNYNMCVLAPVCMCVHKIEMHRIKQKDRHTRKCRYVWVVVHFCISE